MRKPKAAKKPQGAKKQHHAPPVQPGHNVVMLPGRIIGTSKHAGTRKHSGRKHAGIRRHLAKKRGWSPDEELPCCSARAVAESLRLALGVRLSDEDVLGLYWLTASDPDAGASIEATLTAAQAWGLARATGLEPASRSEITATLCLDGTAGRAGYYRATWTEGRVMPFAPRPGHFHGNTLILGLDLPDGESHAVAVGPDGAWWSWREPHDPADFPGAVIDEAWALTW